MNIIDFMFGKVVDRFTARLWDLTGRRPAEAGRAGGSTNPQTPDDAPEMGWGGTSIVGGIVYDDYDPCLMGVQGIRAATRMRRSDAQVRAVQTIVGLPIRSTVWLLDGPKDPSAAEKEATELLRENLFGGMENSWDDLLREATLAIYYGWRVPEIVWEERAGLVAIQKVASRNLELVERWLYDTNGRRVGYLYAGNRPVGLGLEANYSGSIAIFERLPVPMEKTLHFCYDGENDDPQGFGLWRSMYPHWSTKQALYRVLALGVERNLLDLPVGKLPKGAQKETRSKLLRILSRWRAAEDAAIVLEEGQTLEFVGSHRALMDGMPLLQHHNTMLAQAALAQFLNLGQQATGTQALGTVQARLFETAEDANARWIEQTISSQLIKRWCLLNYGSGLRPPVLLHKPIRALDVGAWSAALQTMANGGFLHATLDDEEKIRDLMELPQIPREQLEKLTAAAVAPTKPVPPVHAPPGAARPEPDRQGSPASGDVMEARERCVGAGVQGCGGEDGRRFADDSVEAERAARDAAEARYTEHATAILSDLQDGYLDKLRLIVERIETAAAISQGVPIPDLLEVAVPGTARYRDFVQSYLREVFDAGRTALREDADQAEQRVPNRTRTWIRVRAAAIAKRHTDMLQAAVLDRVLTGIRAELPSAQIFSDAGAVAIAELSRDTQADFGAAAAELLAMVEGG